MANSAHLDSRQYREWVELGRPTDADGYAVTLRDLETAVAFADSDQPFTCTRTMLYPVRNNKSIVSCRSTATPSVASPSAFAERTPDRTRHHRAQAQPQPQPPFDQRRVFETLMHIAERDRREGESIEQAIARVLADYPEFARWHDAAPARVAGEADPYEQVNTLIHQRMTEQPDLCLCAAVAHVAAEQSDLVRAAGLGDMLDLEPEEGN